MSDHKNDTPQRTEISNLGEFNLIQHLTKNIELHHASTIKGVGDDAAVLENLGQTVVMTSDMFLEDVHFDLTYFPLKHLGYKMVVAGISDVYAMNCAPTQMTLNIAVSNRFSVEALDEFYEGVLNACSTYHIDLVGGDTNTSNKGLVVSVSVVGEGIAEKIVYRNTANANDLICVSGDLGAAYLGLLLLERERKIYLENKNIKPDFDDQKYILQRFLRPEARKEIIEFLAENKIVPTAMIDLSDGLSSDLINLCKLSNVGATIYEEKIPIHPDTKNFAYKLNLDPTMCALNGGEDYELLFTINANDFEKIKKYPHIHTIGHITAEQTIQLQSRNNNLHPLNAPGWK